MSFKQRKDAIFNFIVSNMDQNEFDRGQNGHQKVMGFKNYDDFISHQQNVVNDLDDTTITLMEWLRDSFIPESVMMDKEYMSTWQSSGFCFDANNKIVIFHER